MKLDKLTKQERKDRPMASGVLDYFPDALAEVAYTSKIGNDQHNPGQPLHWAKEKSTDHADCIIRHLAQRGTIDDDGVRHSAKVAWRALALLQTELDNESYKEDADEVLKECATGSIMTKRSVALMGAFLIKYGHLPAERLQKDYNRLND